MFSSILIKLFPSADEVYLVPQKLRNVMEPLIENENAYKQI